MPDQPSRRKKLQELPAETFRPRWAGYATAKWTYTPRNSQAGPFYQYVQRQGERPEEHHFKAFLSTRDGDEVEDADRGFSQALARGGVLQRASGIGLGPGRDMQSQHPLRADDDGLVAQAAIDRLRQATWAHLQRAGTRSTCPRLISPGLEGDVRVHDNTIMVTYYNAPDADNYLRTLRELAGQAPSREYRPTRTLAVWIQTRLSLPIMSNKHTPKNR